MDTVLIASILTLVAAVIPLLIAFGTLFRSLVEKKKIYIDSQSIIKYSIKREPAGRSPLQRSLDIATHRLLFYIAYLIYLIIIIIINVSLKSYFLQFKAYYNFIIYSIIAVFGFFYFSAYFIDCLKAFSSHLSNYYYFKNASLIIESDRHYLFNKCHEAIRSMSFKVLEIDEDAGTILAIKVPLLLIGAKKIRIILKKQNGTLSKYYIMVVFLTKINLFESSKVTNSFIDHVISKSQDRNDNAESKVDVSTDVGD